MTATTDNTRTVLRSSEFTCPSCVDKIEGRLNKLEGVGTAKVHFSTGRIEVEHNADVVTVDDIVAAIARAGYKAAPSVF